MQSQHYVQLFVSHSPLLQYFGIQMLENYFVKQKTLHSVKDFVCQMYNNTSAVKIIKRQIQNFNFKLDMWKNSRASV